MARLDRVVSGASGTRGKGEGERLVGKREKRNRTLSKRSICQTIAP